MPRTRRTTLPFIRRIPFFRIFYSTTFTLLSLLLIAALLITPGEQIYQSFRLHALYHTFIIGGFYILTAIIVVFTYGWRLYQNRVALARIPKEGVIVVGGKVGRVVEESLRRSASVAFVEQPRDLRDQPAKRGLEREKRVGRAAVGRQSLDSLKELEPIWGAIEHPGWAPPDSADLPNLHYDPVILELSNLIEAKAVSLAPPDTLYESETNEPQPPDPLAVELLQRPATMGLRDYISHLSSLGILAPPTLGTAFLSLYERARFSGNPLPQSDFRALMSIFAEILRSMEPPDPSIIEELHAEADESTSSVSSTTSETPSTSTATADTVQHTPTPNPETQRPSTPSPSPPAISTATSSSSSLPASAATLPTAHHRQASAATNQSRSSQSQRRREARRPSLASLQQTRSNASVRSTYSTRSRASEAGSVIRLAEGGGPLDLPFMFVVGEGEDGRMGGGDEMR
ncbi:hypothetical protein MMC21_006453 [Puttea exsequens]|nr:hypothetical protein [Puttea exsequens]